MIILVADSTILSCVWKKSDVPASYLSGWCLDIFDQIQKCMTGTYPVQVYLKRFGKAQSLICPHCCSGTIESLTHFACVCPKFREARTSAHNQVREVIKSFLDSALNTEWTLFEETRMANTGLTLRPTPQFTAEQWGRRQPDWVLVSQHHKRIAVVDLCSPSDVHPAQLLAAAMRKQQTHLPLLDALSYYSEQIWTIHVFPWVVGIRDMINPLHVHSLLKFAEIHRPSWRGGRHLHKAECLPLLRSSKKLNEWK